MINEAIPTPKSTNQTLTEYNFINPYNITLIHEVLLPTGIRYILPLVSSSALLSNLVYYLAINTTDKTSMIVVYRLGTSVLSSIYQIIPYSNNNISPGNIFLNTASLLN